MTPTDNRHPDFGKHASPENEQDSSYWALRAGMAEGLISGLLTPNERRAVELAGELFGLIAHDVVGNGSTRRADLIELCAEIHHIQSRILAQAGARAFPDQFRLLGDGRADR